MNKGLTVEDLFRMCINEIKRGNGKKHIIVSDDDEGNGYHTLFYGIDSNAEDIEYALTIEHDSHTPNEVVLLG